MKKIKLPDWQVGCHDTKDTAPAEWIPATVPGAVQLDYAAAKNYDSWYFAENYKDYLWMEDRFFTYRASFAKPDLTAGQQLYFVCKGIDYQFEISLNGTLLHTQEGMFTPVELNLTAHLADSNTIEVTVFPAPKSQHKTPDRSQANRSVKPAFSYGWDFHPRLIPSGIWDDTYLTIKETAYLSDVDFSYILNNDLTAAELTVTADTCNPADTALACELTAPDGTMVLQTDTVLTDDTVKIIGTVNDIQLWWPHDHGDQPLYTLTVRLTDGDDIVLDTHTFRIGFKKAELVMNPGTWYEDTTPPWSRSRPPITIRINNQTIFAKGTNFAADDVFPGTTARADYKKLLEAAKACNMNLIRMHGGAPVRKESFFELCDEMGLLVWQEFMMACNTYPDDAAYLQILEQEATSIIKRVKKHACLTMWCGGNELFNFWSGMTDQALPLRLINSLCYRLDPGTPFIPTSPLAGMAHGHYLFADTRTGTRHEVFEMMRNARNTAYPEFAISGISPRKVLEQIIPAAQLWPPAPGTSWETHHAFGAWEYDESWLRTDMIKHYFGECRNLDEMIERSELAQREGLKFIFEEARRQKPYCSMALNWCFNEPWPTAANCSIVNWPCTPKAGYYGSQDACRPVLVSARIERFTYKAGDLFETDIYLLNDTYEKLPAGEVTVSLMLDGRKTEIQKWKYDAPEPNTNVKGPRVSFEIPELQADRIELLLEHATHPEYDSRYIVLYKDGT